MKRIFILLVMLSSLNSLEAAVKKETTLSVKAAKSNLIGGTKLADGGGVYAEVVYDVSSSSVVILRIRDISQRYYTVLNHNASPSTIFVINGYLYGYGFQVTIDYPGHGPLTLTFNGPFNYAPAG